jgi:hypothetical protein
MSSCPGDAGPEVSGKLQLDHGADRIPNYEIEPSLDERFYHLNAQLAGRSTTVLQSHDQRKP